MSTKQSSVEAEQALQELLELVKPGDTIYTILRHVSRSGMSRTIDMVILTDDGPTSLIGRAYKVLGMPIDRDRWGIKIGGCGMDMGFALVYNLSSALFKNGFGCVGEKCPASDHCNGDIDYTPHGHRKPVHIYNDPDALKHWHKNDGGYALRQRWL